MHCCPPITHVKSTNTFDTTALVATSLIPPILIRIVSFLRILCMLVGGDKENLYPSTYLDTDFCTPSLYPFCSPETIRIVAFLRYDVWTCNRGGDICVGFFAVLMSQGPGITRDETLPRRKRRTRTRENGSLNQHPMRNSVLQQGDVPIQPSPHQSIRQV
jgi:hypothetical protein